MITYVNTVFVNNAATLQVLTQAPAAASSLNVPSTDAGKFVIMGSHDGADSTNDYIDIANANADVKAIRIGLVTKKNMAVHANNTVTYQPIIKWSNVIKCGDIRNITTSNYAADTEDVVTVDFTGLNPNVLNLFDEGGKRIIVRLSFKDLPTRFRQWTESYEYITKVGDTTTTIASGIADLINKQWKRARVVADGTTTAGKLVLTALPYDDDDVVDSISWANKVRFNVNIYYTDPAAEGWDSKNKFFPVGVKIAKTPGKQYEASAKLVRDREAQAMGYLGILNRGEGTWPVIKPDMETKLDGKYNALTLEFENEYLAADNIFRKTKQTVEIYAVGSVAALASALQSLRDNVNLHVD